MSKNEAEQYYKHERTTSLCKHDLSKATFNKKILFLIKKGWTFLYPPQNVTADQEKSMMKHPTKDWYACHYYTAYKESTNPTLFDFI